MDTGHWLVVGLLTDSLDMIPLVAIIGGAKGGKVLFLAQGETVRSLLFVDNSVKKTGRVYLRSVDMQVRCEFFSGFFFWRGFFFRPSVQGEGPLT